MTESFEMAPPGPADASSADARSNPAVELAQRAAAFLSPGDLVLEVGVTELDQPGLIARLCRVRVIVFERDPERAVLLAQHIGRATLGDRIEARSVALGAQTTRNAACGATAPTVALDDVPLPSRPRLITIGPAESTVEILRGAEQLIQAHRPCIHVRTPNAVELGMALTLLGGWGYEPRGQFGPSSNLLCIPSASALVSTRPATEQPTARYSDLASRNESLRQVVTSPRAELSAPMECRESVIIDMARRLERLNVMLAQQSNQSRRLEAQLITLKRRIECLTTDRLPREFNGPRKGSRPISTKSNTPSRRQLVRKLRKLSTRPSAFFNDSQHSVLRFVGRVLFAG